MADLDPDVIEAAHAAFWDESSEPVNSTARIEAALRVGERWQHHTTGVYIVKRFYADQGRWRVTIREEETDKLSEVWADYFHENFTLLAAREEPQGAFTRADLESDEAFRAAEAILIGLFGDPSPEEEHADTYGMVINAVLEELGARAERKSDLEVSRLLLQVATERERTAQALTERDEALTERDEAEGYQATVSDELVERVAKAIFEAGRGPHRVRSGDRDTPQFPWEKVPAEPKTGYRMQARAAIAVLGATREDTERPKDKDEAEYQATRARVIAGRASTQEAEDFIDFIECAIPTTVDTERPDARRFRIAVNPQSGDLSVTQIAGEPYTLLFLDDGRVRQPPPIEAVVRDTEREHE
jgi:hypothetical protein